MFCKEVLVRGLAARAGKVLSVVLRPAVAGEDFVRVRVELEASKPLTRVVVLSPEGAADIILRVTYEKVPKFCEICGCMGHVLKECSNGV